MRRPLTYQMHANANMEGRDLALRITLTAYDDAGNEVASRTWRRHVIGAEFDGLEWTAAYAATELAKLARDRCTQAHELEPIEPEITLPLF